MNYEVQTQFIAPKPQLSSNCLGRAPSLVPWVPAFPMPSGEAGNVTGRAVVQYKAAAFTSLALDLKEMVGHKIVN